MKTCTVNEVSRMKIYRAFASELGARAAWKRTFGWLRKNGWSIGAAL